MATARSRSPVTGSRPISHASPPADHARYVTELFRDHHLELVRLAVLMVGPGHPSLGPSQFTSLPSASAGDPQVAVAW
jgi:hypothetical protein